MCRRALVAFLCLAIVGQACARALLQDGYPGCPATSGNPASHTLTANSSTVHWGYFYEGATPALVVSSGDTVEVAMITHHAGDDYDKMIKGDPDLEDIYYWAAEGQNVDMRGANGKGDGVHILTGPIYVCGAEPGDVLQIDILDLSPRWNPSTGQCFGSNAAANWGYQFRAGFTDGDKREVITIYEVTEENGTYYVSPDYSFRFAGGPTGYPGPTLPCTAAAGEVPRVESNWDYRWENFDRLYPQHIPCESGNQTWPGYYYPGLITTHPTGTEDESIRGFIKFEANLHIGNIGLAPASNVTVHSVPPLPTGGNMDNTRVAKGATLYLPVEVAGALLSMGDAHTAQGDSELDGTGIETSINGKFKLTLHKKDSLPKIVQNLKFPLIENDQEYVVQGYTYADYLNELPNAGDIFGLSSLDRAMVVACKWISGLDAGRAFNNETRDWLMDVMGWTEDQAITAITVAGNFAVTQVVDGNFGLHCVLPKRVFKVEE
ncbi:hypothetical protein N2152v2_001023 [Parachlorella kessleri]